MQGAVDGIILGNVEVRAGGVIPPAEVYARFRGWHTHSRDLHQLAKSLRAQKTHGKGSVSSLANVSLHVEAF